MSGPPVNLLLDLRAYARRLEDPEAFIDLWAQLSPALAGKRLEAGRTYTLGDVSGDVSFAVMAPIGHSVEIGQSTDFAIHSVLEPANLRYACDQCRAEGRSVYGPFVCQPCAAEGRDGRACDAHVAILDGSMRSQCLRHAPMCECGRPGTFWCQGASCRRNRAWCEKHRRSHHNDPDHSYCEACYAVAFPTCEQAGCQQVGSLTCEHVDPRSLVTCGRHACPTHMHRWQVFGPEEEGLTLCSRHRGVKALDDPGLIAEIILGTAGRRVARRRGPMLPTLQSVRHILRKVRSRTYGLDEIAQHFERFSLDVRATPDLQRETTNLLKLHEGQRARDRSRDEDDRVLGRQHFERLKLLMIARGQIEAASLMTFSDYRPRQNRLFVKVPKELAGRFVGTQGRNVKDLSAALGVQVGLERDGQEPNR